MLNMVKNKPSPPPKATRPARIIAGLSQSRTLSPDDIRNCILDDLGNTRPLYLATVATVWAIVGFRHGPAVNDESQDFSYLCFMYSKPDGDLTSLKPNGVHSGSNAGPTGQMPSWA